VLPLAVVQGTCCAPRSGFAAPALLEHHPGPSSGNPQKSWEVCCITCCV